MTHVGHEIIGLPWLWKAKLMTFCSKSTDYSVLDCVNISFFELISYWLRTIFKYTGRPILTWRRCTEKLGSVRHNIASKDSLALYKCTLVFIHSFIHNKVTSRCHGCTLLLSVAILAPVGCVGLRLFVDVWSVQGSGFMISEQLSADRTTQYDRHDDVVCPSVRLSCLVCMWRCSLWLNDTSYSKSVWTSEWEVPC